MAVAFCLDDESDYGISIEEETLLSQLLSDLPTPPSGDKLPLAQSVAIASGFAAIDRATDNNDAFASGNSGSSAGAALCAVLPQPGTLSTELPDGDEIAHLSDMNRTISGLERSHNPAAEGADAEAKDERPPLLRFRSFPKKPFSVSDLTASSWCELQYWYTLTKLPYGRKTRTAAMKEGTKIHKDLEDEVHTTVHVEITTKEDAFGLRVWNLIQGLRTLRETGLTRELEVWGLVEGNFVNGVIDGLSHTRPDPQEEKQPEATQDQPSITSFFPSNTPKGPLVYLTDVKTRGTRKAANTAQLRPAMVQLYLYHRLLSEMAAQKLDFFKVFRRYNLDPDDFFSDTFLAQMMSMHDTEFFDSSPASEAPGSSPDLIKYRSLRELIPLLASEISQTFPQGADSIAPLLSVEYRFRGDGSLIDNRTFPMDGAALDAYLGGSLQWWKGEREPQGVQIEDAWKCMMCEFADDCTWRRGLDETRLANVRRRLQKGRTTS
ncbi:exonuclease V a 5' deoxyribonuclease-domain-containing protein [Plectosphaerella plurivora]|uniref:Exonuclease V a 5' deoxyribonuclease-domain-containing protein n=1 Tax=Plectosphaerella plurivora TaxID=936078 RepID=A0A9P9ABL6_9PEZI|nr:exonuclease V a 5' deoxyribonuclease-domain-containing protein [Plectosphaerella plurivora]